MSGRDDRLKVWWVSLGWAPLISHTIQGALSKRGPHFWLAVVFKIQPLQACNSRFLILMHQQKIPTVTGCWLLSNHAVQLRLTTYTLRRRDTTRSHPVYLSWMLACIPSGNDGLRCLIPWHVAKTNLLCFWTDYIFKKKKGSPRLC